MELQDIIHQGGDNVPGIGQYIWYIDINDVETLPRPDTDDPLSESGKIADLATIKKNIVLKENKKFNQLYVTLETGTLRSETQGAMDCKNSLNVLEFFHPGTKAEALGFKRLAQNKSLIFLVPELDGQWRLFGNKNYPAKLDAGNGENGPETSGRKGTLFTFRSVDSVDSPVFEGKIDLTGAGYESGSENDFQTIFAV